MLATALLWFSCLYDTFQSFWQLEYVWLWQYPVFCFNDSISKRGLDVRITDKVTGIRTYIINVYTYCRFWFDYYSHLVVNFCDCLHSIICRVTKKCHRDLGPIGSWEWEVWGWKFLYCLRWHLYCPWVRDGVTDVTRAEKGYVCIRRRHDHERAFADSTASSFWGVYIFYG